MLRNVFHFRAQHHSFCPKGFLVISHVTFLFNEQTNTGQCYTITFISSVINTVPDFARIRQTYRNEEIKLT